MPEPPPEIMDLTQRLQVMLREQGADTRTVALLEPLVRSSFDAGRARGVDELKAVVDEHLV